MNSEGDPLQLLREGQAEFFADPPNYIAAESAFRAATSLTADWGEPFHWLGCVYERLGKLQEAVDAFRRAVDLLAGDSRPLIALGRLQSLRGEHVDAIKLFQLGLVLKPHYGEADARLMLAEAFERAEDIENAVAQWRIVVGMEPTYPSHGKPMTEARQKLAKHRRS